MTFNETVQYLNSLNRFGSVLGLDSMRALVTELNDPQDGLSIIHVTGTNGKGSVCTFLSEILNASGYSTGMYNSPAVICEYDQYKLNGKVTDKASFAKAVSDVKRCCDELNKRDIFPTRFEVETAAAFVLFADKNVDIAIIETGLGGKDDATCVIDKAVLHVITSISEDHIPVLGNDIREIAENKSHIIKSDSPTVIYKSDYETYEIIKKRCGQYGSPLYYVNQPDEEFSEFSTYQKFNASLAKKAAEVLSEFAVNITHAAIITGIKTAHIPFRFEKLCDDPLVIADGAHNPDGVKRLIESLNDTYGGHNFIFVTGIFKDKDYEKMCELTGHAARKIFAVSNDLSVRSLATDELANILKKYNDNVSVCGTIEQGIDSAIAYAGDDQDAVIVLSGSLSWLNRAKQYLLKAVN